MVDTLLKNNNVLIIPEQMFDFYKVLEQSALSGKYEANNWLLPDGNGCDHKSMHASMFRHLAQSSVGINKDYHSGLHPLLHLACRALMVYCRNTKNLVHSKDIIQ
jgi:dATP/dGTP diphosphohydrolase